MDRHPLFHRARPARCDPSRAPPRHVGRGRDHDLAPAGRPDDPGRGVGRRAGPRRLLRPQPGWAGAPRGEARQVDARPPRGGRRARGGRRGGERPDAVRRVIAWSSPRPCSPPSSRRRSRRWKSPRRIDRHSARRASPRISASAHPGRRRRAEKRAIPDPRRARSGRVRSPSRAHRVESDRRWPQNAPRRSPPPRRHIPRW